MRLLHRGLHEFNGEIARSRIDAGLLASCVALSLIALVLPNANRDPVAGALRKTIVAPLVGLQNGAERWRAAWLAGQQRQLAADSVAMRVCPSAWLPCSWESWKRSANCSGRPISL